MLILGAIERIRKQIKQQKDNLSSPEMQGEWLFDYAVIYIELCIRQLL